MLRDRDDLKTVFVLQISKNHRRFSFLILLLQIIFEMDLHVWVLGNLDVRRAFETSRDQFLIKWLAELFDAFYVRRSSFQVIQMILHWVLQMLMINILLLLHPDNFIIILIMRFSLKHRLLRLNGLCLFLILIQLRRILWLLIRWLLLQNLFLLLLMF